MNDIEISEMERKIKELEGQKRDMAHVHQQWRSSAKDMGLMDRIKFLFKQHGWQK